MGVCRDVADDTAADSRLSLLASKVLFEFDPPESKVPREQLASMRVTRGLSETAESLGPRADASLSRGSAACCGKPNVAWLSEDSGNPICRRNVSSCVVMRLYESVVTKKC